MKIKKNKFLRPLLTVVGIKINRCSEKDSKNLSTVAFKKLSVWNSNQVIYSNSFKTSISNRPEKGIFFSEPIYETRNHHGDDRGWNLRDDGDRGWNLHDDGDQDWIHHGDVQD